MYVHLTLASRTIWSNAVMSSSGSRNFHGVLWKNVLAMMGEYKDVIRRCQVIDKFQGRMMIRDGEEMNQVK
jgi:hypothetical protein